MAGAHFVSAAGYTPNANRKTRRIIRSKTTIAVDDGLVARHRCDDSMDNQRDLVEVVAELKQVLCIKG